MATIAFQGTIKKVAEKFVVVLERHSKPDGKGGWETVGYSEFQVWIPQDQRGELFTEKDWVEVTGRQKTETVEKDGKTYKNLVVSADHINVKRKSDPVSAVQTILAPATDDSLPF